LQKIKARLFSEEEAGKRNPISKNSGTAQFA
jgi:hypothetical protein